MILKNNKIKKDQKGFTFIETLLYIFISSMLILIISSMVMSIFNIKRQFQASYLVHNNARFITNFLMNRIHNVDSIQDASPLPEGFHFYEWPDIRFSIDAEGNDLVYRETHDVGAGFPDQSTATAMVLNSNKVIVSDLTLTPISDAYGQANQGINITFTLTTGNSSYRHGYLQKTFNTFISIR
ncbi:prepilin-type N-terminal cleavage/methylation domain-containing protein [Patescibacteria group bacterium]|nr:prepilin-type N-terminal cleavage/methylation domain-containing protein [Patescibacteria group bacterium]